MTAGFPDFVFNSPQDREVLRRVFSYKAKIYDLGEYEAVGEGIGQRVWDMIESERKHQADMEIMRARIEKLKAKYPDFKEYDYKSGYKPF